MCISDNTNDQFTHNKDVESKIAFVSSSPLTVKVKGTKRQSNGLSIVYVKSPKKLKVHLTVNELLLLKKKKDEEKIKVIKLFKRIFVRKNVIQVNYLNEIKHVLLLILMINLINL